jgi:excisionase family DNA binding protein
MKTNCDSPSHEVAPKQSDLGSNGFKYLKKRQVAVLLGLSQRSIENLMARGIIPHIRLSERCVRFLEADVHAAMAAMRKGPR